MATAANAWLGTVSTTDGAQLAFAAEARRDWHFVSRSRPGVALQDMTPAQCCSDRSSSLGLVGPRGPSAPSRLAARPERVAPTVFDRH